MARRQTNAYALQNNVRYGSSTPIRDKEPENQDLATGINPTSQDPGYSITEYRGELVLSSHLLSNCSLLVRIRSLN